MTPDIVFSCANLMAMAGWLLLALFPRSRWASTYVAGRAIPLVLAACYLAIVLVHGREWTGGFGSLPAVAQLFQSRWALLAGWIHYLAFDLFIGAWETRDANQRGTHRLVVLLCLFLTFLFGPIGLLSYFGLRSAVLSRRSRVTSHGR